MQYLFFLNLKFQGSSLLLRLYKPVCVGPGWNPNCWFSNAQTHLHCFIYLNLIIMSFFQISMSVREMSRVFMVPVQTSLTTTAAHVNLDGRAKTVHKVSAHKLTVIHAVLWKFNPFLTYGLSHHYHLDESTFIFRGTRSDFKFSYKFFMKILVANRIAPDGTQRSAASHLGLTVCLCPIFELKNLLKFQKYKGPVTGN